MMGELADGSDFAMVVAENGVTQLDAGVCRDSRVQVHDRSSAFRKEGAESPRVKIAISREADDLGIYGIGEAALVIPFTTSCCCFH
jgi:hypothetical protein